MARLALLALRVAPRAGAAARAALSSSSHADFAPRAKAPAPGAPEALLARVRATLAARPVVLFMKGSPAAPQCGFSAQVVRVLAAHGVVPHGEDVLQDAALRAAMKDFSAWPTFPQLYVRGEFVGGCDIVTAMHQSGELKALLAGAAAAPAAGAKAPLK